MRYFEIVEQTENGDEVQVWSEDDIIDFYWDYWSGAMVKAGKGPVNREACIDDWIVCNWGVEV